MLSPKFRVYIIRIYTSTYTYIIHIDRELHLPSTYPLLTLYLSSTNLPLIL